MTTAQRGSTHPVLLLQVRAQLVLQSLRSGLLGEHRHRARLPALRGALLTVSTSMIYLSVARLMRLKK